MSPKSDLASLSEGAGFLARRPFATLALAILGMALAALPPLAQIRLHLPNDDGTRNLLFFAAIFPLETYFLPRFLAEADASAGDRPLNPPGQWQRLFDQRWLKAMGGKFLLSTLFGLGLVCMIIPGLMVLLAFGWVPMRILLRGETLVEAARGSYQMMVRSWRSTLWVGLALMTVNLGVLILISWAMGSPKTAPPPETQLTQPSVWVANLVFLFVLLWTSASLLALFRRIEAPAQGTPGN